jgi:hypothetical protein
MLEIIFIIYLSKLIGKKAYEKGHNAGTYQFILVSLWILGEIIGAIVGKSTSEGPVVYLFALMGAALGAVISFVIVNNLEERDIEGVREKCTVVGEKLTIYNKTQESLGILTELEIGSEYLVFMNDNFSRFYQVQLADGQTGYILRTSKHPKKA